MDCEVDGHANGQSDGQRLDDVQLPAHQNDAGDGASDGQRDRDDGVEGDEDITDGEEENDEGHADRQADRLERARSKRLLQVVELEEEAIVGDKPTAKSFRR